MSRLPSAQASASPEVPAPLATAQAANDDGDSSSYVATDPAVAAGISAEGPVLISSSSPASVPADGVGHEESRTTSSLAASRATSVPAQNRHDPFWDSIWCLSSTLELQPSPPSAVLGQPASLAVLPGSIFLSQFCICEAVDHHALSAGDRGASVLTCACAAFYGSLRGVHTSLFLQQSGYLMTPLLDGTSYFCKS
ncbi:TPA: hypothetical protein ACH3X1_004155 [Trebouxia sp. C0004]